MFQPPEPIVYQLKVVLLGISTMIWRRLLVCGDSTITDLHYIMQIVMGWSDDHLNRFRIQRFAFVNNYDDKPKRRLFEVLKSQGMQANQQVTFLSDGQDVVRDLQLYLNPNAEHILDWFHIAISLS